MLTGLAYVTAIAIVVTFGTFLGGVRRFFLRPDGLPRPMRRLATTGVILAAVGAVWTAMSPVAIWRLALANGGLALATGLFRWARRTVKGAPLPIAWSETAPSAYVTTGPYRWIRHPFYASYVLGWSALAMATAGPAFASVAVVHAWIYWHRARTEEIRLASTGFAEAVARHREHAGMFLPRWPLERRGRRAPQR